MITVPSSVVRCPSITASDLRLLLYFLKYCPMNDRGSACWPSYARIEADTGLSDFKITGGIRRLAGLGVVRVGKRKSRRGKAAVHNTYIIAPWAQWKPLGIDDVDAFVSVSFEVATNPAIDPDVLRLLLIIRSLADPRPSLADLRRWTGLGRDKITAKLAAAESAGVLRVERTGCRNRNTYRLDSDWMTRLAALPPPNSPIATFNSPVTGVAIVRSLGCIPSYLIPSYLEIPRKTIFEETLGGHAVGVSDADSPLGAVSPAMGGATSLAAAVNGGGNGGRNRQVQDANDKAMRSGNPLPDTEGQSFLKGLAFIVGQWRQWEREHFAAELIPTDILEISMDAFVDNQSPMLSPGGFTDLLRRRDSLSPELRGLLTRYYADASPRWEGCIRQWNAVTAIVRQSRAHHARVAGKDPAA